MRALRAMALTGALLASVPAMGQGAAETIWEAPRAGRWTVKAIRSGDDGPAQCIMSNIGEGSGVAYAIVPGDIQRLVLQNSEWRIPPGAAAMIQLQIDRRGPWEVAARRSPTASDTIFIEARFDDSARRLLAQMRGGKWLQVVFASGDHYRVSLDGSGTAGRLLLECHQRFGRPA